MKVKKVKKSLFQFFRKKSISEKSEKNHFSKAKVKVKKVKKVKIVKISLFKSDSESEKSEKITFQKR